jgi:hypothetical protein
VESVLSRDPLRFPIAYLKQTQVFHYVSTVKIELLNTQRSADEQHSEHLPKTEQKETISNKDEDPREDNIFSLSMSISCK